MTKVRRRVDRSTINCSASPNTLQPQSMIFSMANRQPFQILVTYAFRYFFWLQYETVPECCPVLRDVVNSLQCKVISCLKFRSYISFWAKWNHESLIDNYGRSSLPLTGYDNANFPLPKNHSTDNTQRPRDGHTCPAHPLPEIQVWYRWLYFHDIPAPSRSMALQYTSSTLHVTSCVVRRCL